MEIVMLKGLVFLSALVLARAVLGDGLPDEFVVADLRRSEISYYGIDNKKAGLLTRADLEKASDSGVVKVISFSPEEMKAQLHVPGCEEDIFVLATDIEVRPQDAWTQLMLSDFSSESVCLGDAPPAPPPGRNEDTHAPHALFSCR
ncbi:MAG TPA: hypothetical protein VJ902_10890 [Wenzhouxiangellaceae bacterium]|nr:hypothetical protein [Wenzhouxiangellaceae bacterium]